MPLRRDRFVKFPTVQRFDDRRVVRMNEEGERYSFLVFRFEDSVTLKK